MTHADLSGITCTLLPVHVSQMMSLPSSEPETRCLSRKRADVTSERSEHRFFSLVPSNPLCHLPHYRTGHSSGFRSKPFLHGLPHKLPRIARVVGGRDFVDVPLQHATALGLASLRLFDAGRGRLERRVAALFRLRLRRMHVQTKLDCCYILLRYLALFNEVLKLLLEGGGLGVVLGRHFHGRTREHGRRTRHETTRRRDDETPTDRAGRRLTGSTRRPRETDAAGRQNALIELEPLACEIQLCAATLSRDSARRGERRTTRPRKDGTARKPTKRSCKFSLPERPLFSLLFSRAPRQPFYLSYARLCFCLANNPANSRAAAKLRKN